MRADSRISRTIADVVGSMWCPGRTRTSTTLRPADCIYNEARGRTPADYDEAEVRAKLMVERLLTWEDPWAAIAAVADEMVARADSEASAA